VSFRLIHHGLVDSTSERAFASLANGSAQHGDVHIARGQTVGRGRQGRTWHSTPDEGLYASVVLLPAPPPFKPTALTIATALALFEALTDLGLPPIGEGTPCLKWPNDVEVEGAKLSGILTESRALDENSPHYVVGIGLNVRQLNFPGELEHERPVTSLAKLGVNVTVLAAVEALLARLGPRLVQVRHEHRRLATDFLAASQLGGSEVRVCSGKDTLRGELLGLSVSDGIELRCANGQVQHLPLEFVRTVERISRS
jgi:BirA family biotin operon repressor/biotin-[acetyl-CoA-carboxylase] ligase